MEQRRMAQVLQQHGVRPTQQRLAVYEYLLNHRTHPSADTVYEALVKQYPTFSRTTVYNSLHALVEASLIRELPLDAEERHYDADIGEHGHFLCRHCRRIVDVPLEHTLLQAMRPQGYAVDGQEVTFSGFCPACAPQV